MIVEDKVFKDDYGLESHSAGSEALDPELFAMLKDLRSDMSKKHKLPPYVGSRMSPWNRWQPCILLICRSCRTSRV